MKTALATFSLALVACLVLAPALQTGWFGDDAFYSFLPAAIDTGRVNLWRAAYASFLSWLTTNGRLHPGIALETYAVFAFVRDRLAYKAFLIVTTLLSLVAAGDFMRRLWGRRFAFVAMLATVACFQIRGYHDAFIAYNGLIQVFAIGMFLSLSAFSAFVKHRRAREGVLALVCYVAICSIYEIGYILAPLYFFVALALGKSIKRSASAALPFASIGVILLVVSAVLRSHAHVDPASLYAIHANVFAYLSALADQITAALPLSYLLLNPSRIFTPFYNGFNIPYDPLVFVAGAFCAFFVLNDVRLTMGTLKMRCAIAVGCLLIGLPAIEIAALLKYQRELEPGLGYLPVFVEYFGFAMLVATIVSSFRPSRALGAAGIFAVAGILTLDAGANTKVADALRVPYLVSRESFERAVDRGLLQGLPAASMIAIQPSFPWVCDDGTCIDGIGTSDMISYLAKRRIDVGPMAPASGIATYDEKTDTWSFTRR